jgi:polar amino acid transport system substrate-binding protein
MLELSIGATTSDARSESGGNTAMRGTRIWIVAVAVAAATALVGAGCGGSSSTSGGGQYDLITSGTLTIGSDIPYPPFEQGKPPDYTGFDVELVDAIAKNLNLDTDWNDTGFGTIFADLQAGKFDFVASATTITPSRSKRVTFSDPYFDSDQSLLVQKGSSIQSTDDITSSTTIGVQQGTTGQAAADKTDGDVKPYPGGTQADLALNNGQVDAVIQDLPVSANAIQKFSGLEIAQTIHTGEQYGFAMQLNNTALVDAVNKALKELTNDGTYTTIYQKYFNTDPPEAYQASS